VDAAREDAVLDCGENADGANEVLVDRVVMIHVELHHGDDLSKVRNEAAEHTASFMRLSVVSGSWLSVSMARKSALAGGLVAHRHDRCGRDCA
jgi:hypothetical protein